MPYIDLPDAPGILGPMLYRRETAEPLNRLAEVLLRDPEHSLAPWEREAIAARVSHLNRCEFCERSHSAFAAAQHGGDGTLVDQVTENPETAPITPKLRALLRVAERVQASGRAVRAADVAAARAEGATDLEIHDTVLIAAAFCMYNRYVDGLATVTPADEEAYAEAARTIVAEGYGHAVRAYEQVLAGR
jgi:uncharacterized peroxidase-related enzyme